MKALKTLRPVKARSAIAGSLAFILSACAGNFDISRSQNNTTTNPAEADQLAVADAIGARVSFHFSDYFSLTAPKSSTGCAGDSKNYYDPIKLRMPSYSAGYDGYSGVTGATGPVPFATSQVDPEMTAHPAFIKNISVDLTDANADVDSNLAHGCSLGNGPTVPPTSNCASFDYGAVGGIPTSMGGTVLLIGGIQDYNYSGGLPAAYSATFPYKGHTVACGPAQDAATLTAPTGFNRCDSSVFALGVNTLPASAAGSSLAAGITGATGPISTWSNISAAAGYSGPKGLAGAASAFDQTAGKALLFGGSAPFGTSGPTGPSSNTNDTWTFDTKLQSWSKSSGNFSVASDILTMNDVNGSGTLQQWQKPSSARAVFGYTVAQGYALSKMSGTGTITAPVVGAALNASTNVDLTDRILILGGLNSYGYDLRKFNPTYAPDLIETHPAVPVVGTLYQWADSYHTQLLFNSTVSSGYLPDYSSGVDKTGVNFGLVGARNNTGGANGAGYLLAAGGFDTGTSVNTAPLTQGGSLLLNSKAATASETANYIGVPDTKAGTSVAPTVWSQFVEGAETIPWYGGVSMVPGFDLSTNDVVYFGGSDCLSYLSTTGTSTCTFGNPGRYWRFGTNAGTLSPTSVAFVGSPPQRAGMATARGMDGQENILIVAWGGVIANGVTSDTKIYYLFNDGGTPTWASYTVSSSATAPAVVGNASMVYSHITRKFYLFGGYRPVTNANYGETWELSVSGACTAVDGSCTFTWKKLDANGLTCYPSCPNARRSHRMVEANYYNRNPGGSVGGVASGENTCTNAATPCSFGIFMESGSDGTNYLADRWMFDPTANGGRGHWQKMEEMPPRTLASATTIDYFVPSQNKTVRRAIVFGGETGLQSPQMSVTDKNGNKQYFVAPTLGDTWMYDFDTNSWSRVNLMGKGFYLGGGAMNLPAGGFASETEARQTYNSAFARMTSDTDVPANLDEFTPPPLSGHMMVTRTHSNPNHDAVTSPTALKIPEVFVIGGRTKDGSLHPIDRVYKFCAGSTGEKPWILSGGNRVSQSGATVTGDDDASCDAYDSSTNPSSPSPTADFTGRWLRKTPNSDDASVTVTTAASYLGAATYDPTHDLIVLFGGLKGTTSITDAATLSVSGELLEYIPPSKTEPTGATAAEKIAQTQGTWRSMSTCDSYDAPAARYGHSLNYDRLNQQLILIGGYDNTGAPLTQSVTYANGTTYTLPEVWIGKRMDSNQAANSVTGIPEITTAPCYYWSKISTYGNNPSVATQVPPSTGISHAAAIYIPSAGYNSGYYSMFDSACEKAGPIATGDPTLNKLMAGGVYIDLDRAELGATENLLLNVTYIPLGDSNNKADGTPYGTSESAVFKVHLIRTGLSTTDLQLMLQPRHMAYSDTDKYSQVVQTLSVLAPPATGEIHQEQLMIPLSADASIDRIRIERYSGSGILIDAALYRMGQR